MKRFLWGTVIGGVCAYLYDRWRKFHPPDFSISIPKGIPAIRPVPSGELLVQVDAPAHVVVVYVATQDAAEWVESEADRFGTLHPPEDGHAPYVLIVSPLFNPIAVGQFLFVGYHEGVDDSDNNSLIFE